MTPRDRRALFLGGGMVVVSLFVLRVVPWAIHRIASLREAAGERQATAARAAAVLAASPATRDSLTQVLAGVVALAPALVEGRSGAEAQASLSGVVSLLASRHDLKVLRADALPDSGVGVFSRVGVHAELEGDVTGLAAMVRSLETGQLLLSIPTLTVRASDPTSRVEALRIELDVTGLYLPRGVP